MAFHLIWLTRWCWNGGASCKSPNPQMALRSSLYCMRTTSRRWSTKSVTRFGFQSTCDKLTDVTLLVTVNIYDCTDNRQKPQNMLVSTTGLITDKKHSRTMLVPASSTYDLPIRSCCYSIAADQSMVRPSVVDSCCGFSAWSDFGGSPPRLRSAVERTAWPVQSYRPSHHQNLPLQHQKIQRQGPVCVL